MRESLSSRPKTIPSNYNYQPEDQGLPGSETPGFSCSAEAWAKAERQESEYYDWESYEQCQAPKVEHPAYVERANTDKLFKSWDELLRKLEPLPRNP